MKKTMIKHAIRMISFCLMLAVLLSGSALADAKIRKIGTLSLLNLTENGFAAIQKERMEGVLLLEDLGSNESVPAGLIA